MRKVHAIGRLRGTQVSEPEAEIGSEESQEQLEEPMGDKEGEKDDSGPDSSDLASGSDGRTVEDVKDGEIEAGLNEERRLTVIFISSSSPGLENSEQMVLF
ncbi:uncharacterized protein LTHEOB_11859 [Lasiodiplodia theobromae]|uniref:uncharacterized protein n=1 Tax=Lasiodiplodia theobromae TaxID=45133 RepID=UPI0015C3DED3|nr:uncharacterized protein LTHEOB_11859 [Lasiodiplodia theobromae]KAF4536852.1 hypothetical protein LTHEOB_11859 [Lasiodiplodia theobromae]